MKKMISMVFCLVIIFTAIAASAEVTSVPYRYNAHKMEATFQAPARAGYRVRITYFNVSGVFRPYEYRYTNRKDYTRSAPSRSSGFSAVGQPSQSITVTLGGKNSSDWFIRGGCMAGYEYE